MNCPDCKSKNRKLLESRLTVKGKRRRRFECQVCLYRWTAFADEREGRSYKTRWEDNEAKRSAWRRIKREDALKIITSSLPQRVLAKKYEVSRQAISLIQTGSMYKDIYREIYPARSGPVYYCSGCTSWKNECCSFGFPEAGNDFAMECSVYISNGKPELTAKL